jgi:hypothetical protein
LRKNYFAVSRHERRLQGFTFAAGDFVFCVGALLPLFEGCGWGLRAERSSAD